MIYVIDDTSDLKDVYLEDIDGFVGSTPECYLVQAWYFYYFSTLNAAKTKARSLGVSDEVRTENNH